jgi:N utilization substance protein A
VQTGLSFFRSPTQFAREKSIDREIVIAAMADAIQKAARSRYGSESNIRADINAKTGEIKLQRLLEVVEHADDYSTQIPLMLARDRNPDAQPKRFHRRSAAAA